MREQQEKTIVGRKYQVVPLPAGQGLHVFARVLRILGPAFANIKSFAGIEKAVLGAIGSLAERLDGDDLESICAQLAPMTKVEATPGAGKFVQLKDCFDLHFAGDYLSLFEWLRFALEVNFGPLLEALRQRASAASSGSAAAKPQSSASQQESTGASTG